MSPGDEHLRAAREDGIMTLVLSRPEARNARSPQILVRLAEAWDEFRHARESPRAFKEKRKPNFIGE